MRSKAPPSRPAKCRIALSRGLPWMFALAAMAGVSGCSRDSASEAADTSAASEGSADRYEEQVADADWIPRSTSLQRLGRTNGGYWVGEADGVRVVLRIGGEDDAIVVEEGDADEEEVVTDRYYLDYLAVSRKSEHPRVRVYFLSDFYVGEEGDFLLNLRALWEDARPQLVAVLGTVEERAMQFEHLTSDATVIPAAIRLQPSTGAGEEAEGRRRRFAENEVRRYLSLDEARDR